MSDHRDSNSPRRITWTQVLLLGVVAPIWSELVGLAVDKVVAMLTG